MEPTKDDQGTTTPPVNACAACGSTAPPDAMGLCPNPKCRCVRKGTKLAAKHGPINTRRRQALREQFVRDYRPVTAIDTHRCKQLADVTERLDVVKTGTMDHVRLVQTQQVLVTALEASRAEREKNAHTTSEELEAASLDDLARRVADLTQTIAQLREHEATSMVVSPTGSTLAPETDAKPVAIDASPAPSPAAPPIEASIVTCPYCHKSLADCADMRATRPEIFESLHYDALEFVEKRRKQANDEMYESWRRHGRPNY